MTRNQAQGKDLATAEREAAGFPALLRQSEGELQKCFRDEKMVQRFMRVVLTEFRTKPDLARCTPHSIMASVMVAAQLNLEVGGPMKQGYLIPYKVECTFQTSYIGYLELSRRTGQFRDIDAVLVNENDEFSYFRDPRPNLYHKPNLWKPGAELGVYVYAILANGEPKFLAMDRAEVEKIRRHSKQPNGAPWTTWWGEKAKCSVLRRFLKTQSLCPELARAIAEDEKEFTVGTRLLTTVEGQLPAPSRSEALVRRLAPPAAPEAVDPDDYGGEVPAETKAETKPAGEDG